MKIFEGVEEKDYYEVEGENYNWEEGAKNLRCERIVFDQKEQNEELKKKGV